MRLVQFIDKIILDCCYYLFQICTMRVVPVYLLCATLAVAGKSEETAANNYFGRRLEPVEVTADQETVSYLLPRLTSKYRPNNQWNAVTDPRFYVLTEMESNNVENQVKILVNILMLKSIKLIKYQVV